MCKKCHKRGCMEREWKGLEDNKEKNDVIISELK